MPHIIVQASPNVVIDNPANFLQTLNKTLWDTGHFGQPQDIKARLTRLTDAFIGIDDDQSSETFVYVQLRLMPGRSEALRSEMAEKLLTCLQDMLGAKPMANEQTDNMPIQYAVEVVELSAVYKKTKV